MYSDQGDTQYEEREACARGEVYSGDLSANDGVYAGRWGRAATEVNRARLRGEKTAVLRAFLLCTRGRQMCTRDTELEIMSYLREHISHSGITLLRPLKTLLSSSISSRKLNSFPLRRCEDALLRRDILTCESDFKVLSALLLSTLKWGEKKVQALFVSSSSQGADEDESWVEAMKAVVERCGVEDVLMVGTAMDFNALPRTAFEAVKFVMVPNASVRGPGYSDTASLSGRCRNNMRQHEQEVEAFDYLITKKIPRTAQLVKFVHTFAPGGSGQTPVRECEHTHHTPPALIDSAQRDYILKYLRVCHGFAPPALWRTDVTCSDHLRFRGSTVELVNDRLWGGCIGDALIASEVVRVEFKVHSFPVGMYLGMVGLGAAVNLSEHFMRLDFPGLAYTRGIDGMAAVYECSTRTCMAIPSRI